MKKSKKKKASKKTTLLGGATKSLKKLSKNSVGKLSTTQKVLAGATLGALGVRYLVKRLGKPKSGAPTEAAAPDLAMSDDAVEAEANLNSLG